MKISIIGAGAMGSVYAGLFAEAGYDVVAVDPWHDHVQEINDKGLHLTGASGDRFITGLRASTDASITAGSDLFVLATKGDAVGAAANSIAPFVTQHSLIVTIQNGLGAAERIGAHVATDQVLLGVADGFGASMKGPGHAHHSAMKLIRLGEIDGGVTERLARVTEIWKSAGFNAKEFADIQQLIWEKFLCNVTFSAPCAVFDCTLAEIMANPEWWVIATGCTREAYTAGRAENVNFSFDDPIAYVTAFGQSMPDARPSLALDHRAGRRSEINAINGMVPVISARHNLEAPYNKTLAAIIRAREETFGKPQP
jgi:2-dehydropantoate 2-reductase